MRPRPASSSADTAGGRRSELVDGAAIYPMRRAPKNRRETGPNLPDWAIFGRVSSMASGRSSAQL
jgi:hypothetical protein